MTQTVTTPDRVERKRQVAAVRRDIRSYVKTIQVLAKDLGVKGTDVWGAAKRLGVTAKLLSQAQAKLNSLLNRGDEVAILKRAAKAKDKGFPEMKFKSAPGLSFTWHTLGEDDDAAT
jgi:hypothetical protein